LTNVIRRQNNNHVNQNDAGKQIPGQDERRKMKVTFTFQHRKSWEHVSPEY